MTYTVTFVCVVIHTTTQPASAEGKLCALRVNKDVVRWRFSSNVESEGNEVVSKLEKTYRDNEGDFQLGMKYDLIKVNHSLELDNFLRDRR